MQLRHHKEKDLVKISSDTKEKLQELYHMGGYTKTSFANNLARRLGMSKSVVLRWVSLDFETHVEVKALRKLENYIVSVYGGKPKDVDDPQELEFLHAQLISPYKKFKYPRAQIKTGHKKAYEKPRRMCPYCHKRQYNIFGHLVREHPDIPIEDYENRFPKNRPSPYLTA